jgi:hypothetical protein
MAIGNTFYTSLINILLALIAIRVREIRGEMESFLW